MAVGTRQIVLLTHLASKWPKKVGMYTVRSLVDPTCNHPTVEITRNRNGKKVTEQQRTCYCWTNLTSIKDIYDKLEQRGFIESDDDKFQLTTRGWEILDKSKKAPIDVRRWSDDGYPDDWHIRKSRLKEFQVLYAKVSKPI